MDSTLNAQKPVTTIKDDTSSPAEIEQNVVATRARISEDVEKLAQKVSPENIAENAKSALDDAKEAVVDTVQEWSQSVTDNAGDWSGTVVDVIKRNPLATTLIGVGIGLLAAGSMRAAQNSDDDDYNTYANYMAGRRYDPRFMGGYPSSTPQSSGRIIHSASGTGGATTSGDTAIAADTVEGYSPSPETYQQRGPLYTGRADTYGINTYNYDNDDSANFEQMRYQARRAGRKAKRGMAAWFDDNPLMVGAITAAVGIGLGLSIPSSSYEDELMGDTSDALLEQAKSKVIGAAEAVKETAKETASTVQTEVQSKIDDMNLKETIKDKAKVAEDAIEDITQSAKQTAKDKAKLEADKRNLSI